MRRKLFFSGIQIQKHKGERIEERKIMDMVSSSKAELLLT